MTEHADDYGIEHAKRAAALGIALLAGLIYLLKIGATTVIRSHAKFGTNPILLGLDAVWLATLVACAVAALTGAVNPAVAAGLTTTGAWMCAVGLVEIALNHFGTGIDGDGDLGSHLGDWWR